MAKANSIGPPVVKRPALSRVSLPNPPALDSCQRFPIMLRTWLRTEPAGALGNGNHARPVGFLSDLRDLTYGSFLFTSAQPEGIPADFARPNSSTSVSLSSTQPNARPRQSKLRYLLSMGNRTGNLARSAVGWATNSKLDPLQTMCTTKSIHRGIFISAMEDRTPNAKDLATRSPKGRISSQNSSSKRRTLHNAFLPRAKRMP